MFYHRNQFWFCIWNYRNLFLIPVSPSAFFCCVILTQFHSPDGTQVDNVKSQERSDFIQPEFVHTLAIIQTYFFSKSDISFKPESETQVKKINKKKNKEKR